MDSAFVWSDTAVLKELTSLPDATDMIAFKQHVLDEHCCHSNAQVLGHLFCRQQRQDPHFQDGASSCQDAGEVVCLLDRHLVMFCAIFFVSSPDVDSELQTVTLSEFIDLVWKSVQPLINCFLLGPVSFEHCQTVILVDTIAGGIMNERIPLRFPNQMLPVPFQFVAHCCGLN
jgi:hypothetical protein